MSALLGKTIQGRTTYIEHAGTLAIVNGDWKYIAPSKGNAITYATNIETGISAGPQLYNLKNDIGEKNNLANQYPAKVTELDFMLKQIKEKNN
jgi:arylsulfatase A-like enzyme